MHAHLPIPHCDLKQTRVQMYTDAHTTLAFRSVIVKLEDKNNQHWGSIKVRLIYSNY